MKYLSVCSGVEAATVAWHPLGWEPIAFSEIEKFPSQVLAHHYPAVPNLGDMTKFREWEIERPDLIVGGTPCQSFSVAGLRKGLADPRGNLALTYLALADRYRPEWLVWENVPGVLSADGGRAFGAFLGGLGQLGYGWAYRILDAQYFGVAQRRRRVFVVANARDWRRAAAVLFERQSLSGDPAPRRESRESVAPTIRSGAPNGGAGHGARSGDSKDELIVATHCPVISPALKARDAKGPSSDGDGDGDGAPLIPISFGWQNSAQQGDSCSEHVTPTLDKSKTPAVAVALRGREGGAVAELGDECRNALRASQGGGDKAHVLAFQTRGSNLDMGDIAGTMGTNSGSASGSAPMVQQVMAVRRLTPIECERLQGFEDDFTLIPIGNKMASDGPRYKALGNSMAVPVMAWIGQRIAEVNAQ